MGINYLSLNWCYRRFSEPSTVFPCISWFLTIDPTPSTMRMGHQYLSLEGQAPWSLFQATIDCHHWNFLPKKEAKRNHGFYAWNLSTLSNYSANTCIKVITKIWIKSGKSGSILSTFYALFRVWQFFQVRGCYHQNRDLQSGGHGNHTKRAKEWSPGGNSHIEGWSNHCDLTRPHPKWWFSNEPPHQPRPVDSSETVVGKIPLFQKNLQGGPPTSYNRVYNSYNQGYKNS